MEYLPVLLVAGAGLYVSNLPQIQSHKEKLHFLDQEVPDYGQPVYTLETNRDMELDEFEVSGMSYPVSKAADLSMANINDAWKPYGPPRQITLMGLHDLYQSEAERNAYVRTYGMPPYIRRHEMEVPIGKAEQSNINVTIPKASIKDGPFYSLQFYPRVWVDEENWDHGEALAEPEFKVWGSNNWPSEWLPGENHDDEGRFSHFLNPWGLNGNNISLFRQQYADRTRSYGIPQASIIKPNIPPHHQFY